jgi:Bacterial Ig-like domain (group 3)
VVSWSVAPADTQILLVQHPVLKGKKIASLRLTAEVGPQAPGTGVPTGSAAFMANKTLGTVALSDGQATLTVKPGRVLHRSITITYGGGAGYRPSTLVAPKVTAASLVALARASLRKQMARPAHHTPGHVHSMHRP